MLPRRFDRVMIWVSRLINEGVHAHSLCDLSKIAYDCLLQPHVLARGRGALAGRCNRLAQLGT